MKLYMRDIGQYRPMAPIEEVALAAQAALGSEEARQKLIHSHLRLVVKIAHEFKGFGLPLLELIAEGNIGLMRAVAKFDSTKGARLSSYAVWWIRQAMHRAVLNQARTIRVPVHSAGKMNRIRAARRKLAVQHQRLPTDAEIAEEAKLTTHTVTALRFGKTDTVSLQGLVQSGEDGEFCEMIPDETAIASDDIVQDAETLALILELVRALEEREQQVLTLRFGLNGTPPQTLDEISRTVGRTRDRVRQIQDRAMEKLRVWLVARA